MPQAGCYRLVDVSARNSAVELELDARITQTGRAPERGVERSRNPPEPVMGRCVPAVDRDADPPDPRVPDPACDIGVDERAVRGERGAHPL